jgi:hypothetical protein
VTRSTLQSVGTNRNREKTLDQMYHGRCTSDLLVAYHLEILPAKNQARHNEIKLCFVL